MALHFVVGREFIRVWLAVVVNEQNAFLQGLRGYVCEGCRESRCEGENRKQEQASASGRARKRSRLVAVPVVTCRSSPIT